VIVMTFSVLAVRSELDHRTKLYPQPGNEPDIVELRGHDGSDPEVYVATEVRVIALAGVQAQATARFSGISASVIVTDSRVAIACSRYDKGGGWSGSGAGGLAIALTANAVSKSRARRRSRGRMLVGHVRYEWLRQIDATDRYGWRGSNGLWLSLDDPTGAGGLVRLELVLTKPDAGTAVAESVARRAALRKADQADNERDRHALEEYARAPRRAVQDDGSCRYRLPQVTPA
jgi:hypothetical protein